MIEQLFKWLVIVLLHYYFFLNKVYENGNGTETMKQYNITSRHNALLLLGFCDYYASSILSGRLR